MVLAAGEVTQPGPRPSRAGARVNEGPLRQLVEIGDVYLFGRVKFRLRGYRLRPRPFANYSIKNILRSAAAWRSCLAMWSAFGGTTSECNKNGRLSIEISATRAAKSLS